MTPAGASPASGSGAPGAPLSAGLGRRWCALAYEVFLLFALLLVASFAILPIIGPPHRGTAYSARELYLLPSTSSAFLFLFYVVFAGIYCIGFWSSGRRTLAMKTWGLGLATAAGRTVDIRHATKRYLAAWIGPLAGIAGYALFGSWGLIAGLLNYCWGWLDSDGRFLHDRIAGTRLIKL
jgi:uncharacterized RDD family membrane protein YckC